MSDKRNEIELPTFDHQLSGLNDDLVASLLGLHVERAGGKRRTHYLLEDFPPRTLNSFAIVYITAGRGRFCSGATPEIEISAGDIFFLFPGVWHQYGHHPEESWGELWMIFEGFIPERYRRTGLLDPERPVFHLGVDRSLMRLWNRSLERAVGDPPGLARHLAGDLFAILGRVFAHARPLDRQAEEDRRLIGEVITLMEGNLTTPDFRLEPYAARFHCSYSGLRRRFKEVTGLPPARYLARMRMRAAKGRLLSTDDPVKVIATDMGFDDPYHFSRRFKELEGVSPVNYRHSFTLHQ